MISDWTRHLHSEQKDDFARTIRSSTVALNRLRDLVSEYENELDRIELKLDTYDTPSWAYKQAHINGRRQELQRIKSLVTLHND
jgi:hypothetical protein